MAYNVIHLRFTDAQMEVLLARARLEYKPLTQLIRNAAMEYCTYGPIRRGPTPRATITVEERPNENL